LGKWRILSRGGDGESLSLNSFHSSSSSSSCRSGSRSRSSTTALALYYDDHDAAFVAADILAFENLFL
jgi:hypothetical protein